MVFMYVFWHLQAHQDTKKKFDARQFLACSLAEKVSTSRHSTELI